MLAISRTIPLSAPAPAALAPPAPALAALPGFMRLADVPHPFPDRKSRAAWAAGLERSGLAVKHAGEWYAKLGAALPNGEKLASVLAAGAMQRPVSVPDVVDWQQRDDTERRRTLAACQAGAWWGGIENEFPDRDVRERLAIFNGRHGAELRAAGIGRGRVSLSTLYRVLEWLKSPTADGFSDGRRERGGDDASAEWDQRFKDRAIALFRGTFCSRSRGAKLTYEIAVGEALEGGWKAAPGIGAFRRWLNRVVPRTAREFDRDPRRWEREQVESARRDPSAYRPGQVWAVDWQRADALALQDGQPRRPWLLLITDLATGVIVAAELWWRADAEAIGATLGRAVLRWGAPETLILDNGKDFRSGSFSGGKRISRAGVERVQSVCADLGIRCAFCWGYNPGSKPPESAFAVTTQQFWPTVPAYIGNNPQQRPHDAYAQLRSGGVVPLSLTDLQALVTRFVELRNNTPRERLGGRTPLVAFDQDDPIAKRTLPEALVRERSMARKVVRMSRGGTVIIDGVRYGQDEHLAGESARSGRTLLQRQPAAGQRGDEVLVRYDSDRSRVLVYEKTGEFVCEARNTRNYGATSDDVKALKLRKARARKIVSESAEAARLAVTPMDAAGMLAARERYVKQQTAGLRAAVGAESLTPRPLQLLPVRPGTSAVGALRTVVVSPRASALDDAALPPVEALRLGAAIDGVSLPAADECEPMPASSALDHVFLDENELARSESALDQLATPAATDGDDGAHPLDFLPLPADGDQEE